jgi:YggT family protein
MAIIATVLNLLALAIFVRVILSWVVRENRNPISQMLHTITEPVLAPVRRLLGGGMGGMDFSPMIVIILLNVVAQAITPGGRF